MSRNVEKAKSVLFRYQEQQAEKGGYIDYGRSARPKFVGSVSSLKEAEGWRRQIVQEIKQRVLQIHDEKLPDYKVRDVNDVINKLMKERLSWDYRIKELGGPDYLKSSKMLTEGGVTLRGYTYFGRAKELPGVKEILEQQKREHREKGEKRDNEQNRRKRIEELEKRANLEYYGYLDEPSVTGIGSQAIIEEVNLILEQNDVGVELDNEFQDTHDDDENLHYELLRFEKRASRKRAKLLSQKEDPSQIPVVPELIPPSQQDIESFLVERRKKELAEKYNI